MGEKLEERRQGPALQDHLEEKRGAAASEER